MKILSTVAEVRAVRPDFSSLGLVPTMGFLHQGHLSLVRAARAVNTGVIASLFVNPTQFAPSEDFDRYPRARERDLAMLEAEGCDLVFAPDVAEMYPLGFDTRIEIGGVTEGLEGAVRPGHFTGVATVVAKLFNITTPTRAYFGQKDAQQVAVIRKLIVDLDIPVDLVVCPTIREADGLALSSRNAYLGQGERKTAVVLWSALSAAKTLYDTGERAAEVLRAAMTATLAAHGASADYIGVSDPLSFRDLERVGAAGAVVSLAVRIGATRLIDNIVLPPA
jgi:pantoate--beta-alanine ligase